MLKIACIGEVMIEIVSETTDLARLGVAGDTYNTAVYLAQLLGPDHAQVSYITALGKDRFSDRILTHMAEHGVDSSLIERRVDMQPGLYAIDTDPTGERSFAYWRSDSAARTLFSTPGSMDLAILDKFDVVFASGISVAILPDHIRNTFLAKIDEFRTEGGKFAYDSNHRPSLWDNIESAKAWNEALWRRADFALPSAADEREIFGDKTNEEVIERLVGFGCSEGALKQGAEGPLPIGHQTSTTSFPTASKV